MTVAGDIEYLSEDLHIFRHARHWKRYFARQLRPFLGRSVLEVGAGLGATTQMLCPADTDRWLCLEPDADMANTLEASRRRGDLPSCCVTRHGTVATVPEDERFDTILYIDVLEHIEDDRGELTKALAHLQPGGRIVILAPAHQTLFSPFDEAVGHFRRYDRRSLRAAIPAPLRQEKLIYLDSVGLLGSLGNRVLLKSRMPTLRQIRVWDNLMVPASTIVDRVTAHRLGKSILGVWRAPE